MKRATLPLLLAFAATSALACPGAGKQVDAKADNAPTVASALRAPVQQSKADADRKAIKKADASKPAT